MSGSRTSAHGRSKPGASGAVLVFGEDANDRDAVVELLGGLRPDIPRNEIRPLRKPLALVKGMQPDKARKRHDAILATVRAMQVRNKVRAVLLHEDADEVEPAHVALSQAKEAPHAGSPWTAVAVVPAWEMETWWFLFPEAVASVRAAWRAPDRFRGKNVGLIRNSKEALVKAVRPASRVSLGFPDYEESDSPTVARAIVAAGVIHSPRAKSASWELFVAKVSGI